jgi:methyltransferase (TIGR00027 family)
MFTSLKRVTYQVHDLAKAGEWYGHLLGSEPVFKAPFAVIFAVGDCALWLIPRSESVTPSESTIAWWTVEDIHVAWQRLLDMGATVRAEIVTQNDVQSGCVFDPFGNPVGIMCRATDPKKRSVENQPSESAYNVALCRAIAAKHDAGDVHGADFLAEIFLSEDSRKVIQDPASRAHVKTMVTAPLYGYLHARTVWLDDVFTRALNERFPQIVFLGAGYDSRSYRFADRLDGTHVFELDAPATQQRKIEQLKKAGISLPRQLTFAATNFKSDSLADALSAADFDKSKRTLFIWEGVTYYLPEEAVCDTLDFVRSHSGADSLLCFDYMSQVRQTRYTGEPFLFFLEVMKVEPFLRQHGFTLVEHCLAEDVAQKYNTLPDGSSADETLPYANFVVARTS